MDRGLLADPSTTVTELVERPAFVAAGRAVVVDAGGRPVGLLSRTDVVRILRGRSPDGPGDRAGAIVGR
jgi:CBS domain-containing protein